MKTPQDHERRFEAVARQLEALPFLEQDPLSMVRTFIDGIHLACFNPVRVAVELESGYTIDSNPLLDVSASTSRVIRPDRAIKRLRLWAPEDDLASTEALILAGLLPPLERALEGNVAVAGQGWSRHSSPSVVSSPDEFASSTSDVDPVQALERFRPFHADLMEAFSLWLGPEMRRHGFELPQGRRPVLEGSPFAVSVQATGPSAVAGAQHSRGRGNLPLVPFHELAAGEACPFSHSSGSTAPETAVFASGCLQVGADSGSERFRISMPIFVGDVPWLCLSTSVSDSFESWDRIRRFQLFSLPRFSDQVEDSVRAVLITEAREAVHEMGAGEAPSLDHLNEHLSQLAEFLPIPSLQVQSEVTERFWGDWMAAPANVVDVARPGNATDPGRPRHFGAELASVIESELAALRASKRTASDAMVMGVYMIGHQLGHVMRPVRTHLARAAKGDADEVRFSIRDAQVWAAKAERVSAILNILGTSAKEGNGAEAFMNRKAMNRGMSVEEELGSGVWCRPDGLVIDEAFLARASAHSWEGVNAARVQVNCATLRPLTIDPWIRDGSGARWRPADFCYEELFQELFLNAGKYGGMKGKADVRVSTGSDGEGRPLVVLENPVAHDGKIRIEDAGASEWTPWLRGPATPNGGLYFLALFAKRLGFGELLFRVRQSGGHPHFAVAIRFEGSALSGGAPA